MDELGGCREVVCLGGDFLRLLECSCAEDGRESTVLYLWLGMKQ